MPGKTDPRVLRTRRMFKEALSSLIVRMDFDEITISMLADEAGLRRATFYMHYRDKAELLAEVLEDSFFKIEDELDAAPAYYMEPQGARELDTIIFRHMGKNAAFFRALLSGKGGAYAARFLCDHQSRVVVDKLRASLPAETLLIAPEVLAVYITGVKLQLIMWWLEQDMPYTPEEMGRMAADLAMNGLRGNISPQGDSEAVDPLSVSSRVTPQNEPG